MIPADTDREAAGFAVLEQLGWGHNEGVRELDEDLWRIVTETNFGTIWARPGLPLRDRELICLSILIAVGAHGVALHFKHAHKGAPSLTVVVVPDSAIDGLAGLTGTMNIVVTPGRHDYQFRYTLPD